MKDKWLDYGWLEKTNDNAWQKAYHDALMESTYETTLDVEVISYYIKHILQPNIYNINLKINGIYYDQAITGEMFDTNRSDVLWIVLKEAAYHAYGDFKNHEDKLKTVHNHIMNGNKYGTIYCPKLKGIEYKPKKSYGEYVSYSINSEYISHYPNVKDNSGQQLSSLSSALPGMFQMEKHPVTGKEGDLRNIIMDLNDHYKWTRDEVADWIETLDNIPVFETKEK